MLLHDTKHRDLVEFKPLHKGRVTLFVCGPTVQDHFHVGHARTYIFFDMLAKYLRAIGYSVFYVQNITDIDDKIINRAKEENVDPIKLAKEYTEEYFAQMRALRVDSVNFYARATDHIPEIISEIKRLISRGFAYEAEDGVYFEVRKFTEYGEISGQNLDQIRHGVRAELSESKRNPEDFAIWKRKKPGEPWWDSPWGAGRPGWHVEDTAITELYLGEEYDIHGAGTDLIFPHHEAENAIARSLSGRKFLAKYWIHSGMLNVNSEKMSKSLKNFTTISEVLKNFRPEAVRYAMLNAGYRTMLDFSEEMMSSSRENVEYLGILYRKLRLIERSKGNYVFQEPREWDKITKIMDNDLDSRGVLKELLALASDVNKNLNDVSTETAASILHFLDRINSFLGVIGTMTTEISPSLISAILEIRRFLREKKEFDLSDRIRAELKTSGIYIEDTTEGTDWWIE